MKKLLPVFLVLASGLSCGTRDQVRDFVPGTYIGHFETEYSRGNDTLFINPISKEGNSYSIIRKVTYRRIENGKALPAQFKTENWVGEYNQQTKVLYENSEGMVFSFAPEKHLLYCGNTIYHKIGD